MTSFRFIISRRLIARALPALVLMPVAAGCGSVHPTTSTTGSAAAQNPDVAAAFAYARCLREHGVPNVPDPQVSTTPGGGSVRIAVQASAGNTPRLKAAQKACRGILPAPGSAHYDGPSGKVLLAFAKCLRSHGLSGFPDPNRDGRVTQQMISAAGINPASIAFQRAATACVGVTHGAITAAQVRAAGSGQH
jgi:hypothetical protein